MPRPRSGFLPMEAVSNVTFLQLSGIAVGVSAAGCCAALAVSAVGLGSKYKRFLNAAVPGRHARETIQGGEPAAFRSGDGVPLEGRVFKPEAPHRRTVIFCHQAGSNMAAVQRYGWFLPGHGFNVLTFDFRTEAQGPARRARPWVTDSDVNDLVGAIRYAQSRFGLRKGELGLLGISRGGSAALCAAAREEVVGAVVADGSFDTSSIVQTYMYARRPGQSSIKRAPGLATRWRSRALLRMAEWRFGCRFHSVVRALRQSRHTALLLIHGEGDKYIPHAHAVELYGHAPGQRTKELWLAPAAGHNCTALRHRDEYERRVAKFFDTHLPDGCAGEME